MRGMRLRRIGAEIERRVALPRCRRAHRGHLRRLDRDRRHRHRRRQGGPAQAVTAVVGGQVPIGSTALPPALPRVRVSGATAD
jgi:hypothetical protein